MLKKLTIAAITASFIVSAALADSTNMGVRLSLANMSASGSETTDSSGSDAGGAKVALKEREADFALPSIFVEREIEMNSGMSLVVGLDFVPLTEEVETIGAGTGTQAKIKAGNLITAYIQPSFAINESISVYGKVGYAQGDLDISELSKSQATAAQANDTASTDKSADKSLEGPVYGLGIQVNNDIGAFNFIRLEATRTDFDQIKHTNSNGKILTADAEMDLITLTIGKSF